ncbi:NADH-quinone oxidoreductase subunit C [Neochlamydia sp. AcF95]|uniref:NADH-quinone oxidoreductase subunit C n=1 Tax=Neochlamydia sp. AcF95 TaxID=2795734 RepID=UPI001BC9BAD1|nr:NADH-quinone oxidoreductase subunit C [Neochlamydia sp. AcF95]MBS4170230.1 NADH-quinone oxidoreductase subunit C [Neochlamydia sp. AcF95]
MNISETLENLKVQLGKGIINKTYFLGEAIIEVSKEDIKKTLSFLKQVGYEVLIDLTAAHYLVPTKRIKIAYWLYNPIHCERMRIISYTEGDMLLPSVTDIWEEAKGYECQLFNLFKVRFTEHYTPNRILVAKEREKPPSSQGYVQPEEFMEFKTLLCNQNPSVIIPCVHANPPVN